MANLTQAYELQELDIRTGYRFLFVSVGSKTILKAVRYTYARTFEDKKVYNLGFGDYDIKTGTIVDQAKSNNGDAYKVLQTVLSTIPYFFEKNPDAMVLVQGSDSDPAFAERCRKTCNKHCFTTCKRFRQRIKVYRSYVEKNFGDLSISFWFLGGFLSINRDVEIQRYVPGREYDAILFFRK
ncbi:DUF6934 family protein [Dyadobacter sandarakinus]|uniref:GDSL-like Lipase/Acylhydrolase family protein n=1 Tax=Dyadobacter sandarakinus TaxID=2747268 RepID=A0ABX7IDE9_9BACT|nr:hypothetical protein [Dyadobacter sandarakinus]QRR03547.1 hypothetical protein HWI92_22845 [Dyadobacter sandarakinus]